MSDKFNHLKQKAKSNLVGINQRAKSVSRTHLMVAVGGILLLLVIAVGYMKLSSNRQRVRRATHQKPIDFAGAVSEQYGSEEIKSAITDEQLREDITQKQAQTLNQQLKSQKAMIANLQNSVKNLKNDIANQRSAVRGDLEREGRSSAISKRPERPIHVVNSVQSLSGAPVVGQSTNRLQAGRRSASEIMPKNLTQPMSIDIQTLQAPAKAVKKSTKKQWQKIVPSGTFAKIVLINGADANAGVTGQKNTDPVLMRVLSDGTMPNDKHSSLKGCTITASVYGDISSERGKLRTNMLSCIRDGKVLDIPVQGMVMGNAGFSGIRGHIIMRNRKILESAGLSGFISGLGQSVQQSQTTQSTSAAGTTSSVDPDSMLGYSAASGFSNAASMLTRYYVQLAEQYHPVIELHSGTVGYVMFLAPFSLSTDQKIAGLSQKSESKSAASTDHPTSQGIQTHLTPQQQAAFAQYKKQSSAVSNQVLNQAAQVQQSNSSVGE